MRTIEYTLDPKDTLIIRQVEQQIGCADCIAWDTTIPIDDDHVLDINLYEARDDLPWVDAVLFRKNGNGYTEIGAMDVGDSVFGDYVLDELNVTVIIKEAA